MYVCRSVPTSSDVRPRAPQRTWLAPPRLQLLILHQLDLSNHDQCVCDFNPFLSQIAPLLEWRQFDEKILSFKQLKWWRYPFWRIIFVHYMPANALRDENGIIIPRIVCPISVQPHVLAANFLEVWGGDAIVLGHFGISKQLLDIQRAMELLKD